MVGIYRRTTLMMLSSTFLTPSGETPELDGLLEGETDGFAIDATDYDSLIPAAYVGGPVGGDVLVGTSGVPSYDHVPLDASNLTQSGTSPKMVHFDTSPYVRWSAHNELARSQEFDNATWAKTGGATISADATTAPDGTSTADTMTNGTDDINQNNTLVANRVYTSSIYLKAGTCTWVRIIQQVSTDNNIGWFNASTGATGAVSNGGTGSGAAITATSAGSGWYRVQLTGIVSTSGTAGNVNLTCVTADSGSTRDSGKTLHMWGAQMNRGPIACPYMVTVASSRIGIPQSYDPYEDCYGILVEPAATNLAQRSGELDHSFWRAPDDATITINTVTGPDGTTTGNTLNTGATTESGFGNNAAINPINSGTTYTWSIYAKYAETQWVQMCAFDSAFSDQVIAWFDIQNGVAGTTSTADAGVFIGRSITAVGDGWYRLSLSYQVTTDGANGNVFIVPVTADSGSTIPSDQDTYIWGPQIELGSVATSYIPTLGSTVTRATDSHSALVASIPYSTTEGTVYLDFKNFLTGATQHLWAFVDNATGFSWYVDNNATNFRAVGNDNGSFDVVGTVAAATYDTRHEITFAGKTNDWDWSIDGGTAGGDTSGGFPTSVDQLDIGHNLASVYSNAMIYRLVYVPRHVG